MEVDLLRTSETKVKKKDRLEFVLYKMVCAQEISLADAQRAMATNWIEAWKRYVPSHQHYQFKGSVGYVGNPARPVGWPIMLTVLRVNRPLSIYQLMMTSITAMRIAVFSS